MHDEVLVSDFSIFWTKQVNYSLPSLALMGSPIAALFVLYTSSTPCSFASLSRYAISGPWRRYHQEDNYGLDHWHIWWAYDSWSMQHDCREAWRLSTRSGFLGMSAMHHGIFLVLPCFCIEKVVASSPFFLEYTGFACV